MEVKNFNQDETLQLVRVYCDYDWQKKFENHKRSQRSIWQEMAEYLKTEFGYIRSATQLKEKVKNLKREYYRLKRLPSGSGQENWPYYSDFSRILGTSAMANPVIVVDSLDLIDR